MRRENNSVPDEIHMEAALEYILGDDYIDENHRENNEVTD